MNSKAPTHTLIRQLQCQNCFEIVDLPQPFSAPRYRMTARDWQPPRVPPHDCWFCSGDWDCPRDLEPNWRDAGFRAPCTEEHGECEGALVVGVPGVSLVALIEGPIRYDPQTGEWGPGQLPNWPLPGTYFSYTLPQLLEYAGQGYEVFLRAATDHIRRDLWDVHFYQGDFIVYMMPVVDANLHFIAIPA